jgi:ribosomal protein S18 acetylase RimI-like enzyme
MDRAVVIRPLAQTDLHEQESSIRRLLEDNMRINLPGVEDPAELAGIGYDDMVRFHQDGSAVLIGAFEESVVVGLLWAYRRDVLGERRIHIGHVIVESTARSNGIGARLLRRLEDVATAEGIKSLELMTTIANEKAIGFYEANGFVAARVQLEKKLG